MHFWDKRLTFLNKRKRWKFLWYTLYIVHCTVNITRFSTFHLQPLRAPYVGPAYMELRIFTFKPTRTSDFSLSSIYGPQNFHFQAIWTSDFSLSSLYGPLIIHFQAFMDLRIFTFKPIWTSDFSLSSLYGPLIVHFQA